MFSVSIFWRRVTSLALPSLCFVALNNSAEASSISFPVGVNDSIPNAYVAEVYGSQFIPPSASLADGSAVGLNAANTSIPGGTTVGLNMCLVSVCEGGTEFFGGFADVLTGTVGAYAAGAPFTSQAQANALLFINLAFTGTGPVTIDMHVEGSISGLADAFDGSEYAAGMRAQGYTIDPQTGFTILQGSQLGVGASICQGAGFSGCNHTGTSLSTDISMVLNADPQHELFSFEASATAYAAGAASADGAHTSSLSIILPPGVTLDQSNGFLTMSGEPTFGPPVPEPSTLGFIFLGLGLLVAGRRKAARAA